LVDSIKHANIADQTIASGRPGSKSKKKNLIPIIVVPASPTALINMFNVKEFLVDCHYFSPNEAKQKNQSVKETQIVIEKVFPSGNKRTIQIVDNPSRLSLEDWDRVKAVFAQGQAWQFKGWKWEDPVDLFQHGIFIVFIFIFMLNGVVSGYCLQFDDVPFDKTVSSWNVSKLTISRSKRHLDSTAVLNFWEKLEKFLETS
jgi:parafibromin